VSKPDDLKTHVGHTVQPTGVEAPRQVTTASTDTSAGAANARGTTGATGGAKPTVETTASRIVVRQLHGHLGDDGLGRTARWSSR
jgi:hypothetical protein